YPALALRNLTAGPQRSCRSISAKTGADLTRAAWRMVRPVAGARAASPGALAPALAALLDRHVAALHRAGIDLPGTADSKVRVAAHFEPVRDPSRHATDGEHDREHVLGDAEGLVDDAGVEVDVRVELATHEVVVLERDLLELHADLEQLAR